MSSRLSPTRLSIRQTHPQMAVRDDTFTSLLLQDLTVCRRDTPDQQDCTTSTADASGEASQRSSSSGTNTTQADAAQHPSKQQHGMQHSMHSLPSSSSSKHAPAHSPDTALAESELLAENVPEAVQRLTATDATASSSSALHQSADQPVLTSPTSVALPAADAYKNIASQKDDDSDSDFGLEFNPYSFVKTLPPLAQVIPKHLKTLLPPQTRRCPRKTLVLDLDETLVSTHSRQVSG